MKNKMIRGFLVLIIFSALSCKDDPRTKEKAINTAIGTKNDIACEPHISKNKKNNLNISILLDLSNRIGSVGQQAKDSTYILSLARAFNTHIKGKKLGLLYDKMELFFEPVPNDPKINELASQLKIDYVKGVSKKELMPKTIELYKTVPTQIYELARVASKNGGYPGSDTWGFFKNKVDDYCIDDCYRNILVILTDGYMFHKDAQMMEDNRTSFLLSKHLKTNVLNKSDWQKRMDEKDFGFIVANKDLSNLEVLVLGINPAKNNPYEGDVIRAYWSKWFDEMKVKNYEIKQADLPTHMDKIIQDFILNK